MLQQTLETSCVNQKERVQSACVVQYLLLRQVSCQRNGTIKLTEIFFYGTVCPGIREFYLEDQATTVLRQRFILQLTCDINSINLCALFSCRARTEEPN